MPRPFTLFTGQWADLPFEEVAKLASGLAALKKYDFPASQTSFDAAFSSNDASSLGDISRLHQ